MLTKQVGLFCSYDVKAWTCFHVMFIFFFFIKVFFISIIISIVINLLKYSSITDAASRTTNVIFCFYIYFIYFEISVDTDM